MTNTAENGRGTNTPMKKDRLLLVVDAETNHLYHTGILLQRLAYTVYTARTAEEALEIMRITRPALVLTEVALPKMDGVEFLKQIKRNPRMQSVPVIVYTASKEPGMREACMREGCAAFLVKPLDPDALYAAIQKVTEETPRSTVRLNILLRVLIGEQDRVHPDEYITALSDSGMYVSTPRPLPVGARLPMTILLRDDRTRVGVTVLYSFASATGPLRTPGMGVRFDQIRPEDSASIRAFIHELITRDIATA